MCSSVACEQNLCLFRIHDRQLCNSMNTFRTWKLYLFVMHLLPCCHRVQISEEQNISIFWLIELILLLTLFNKKSAYYKCVIVVRVTRPETSNERRNWNPQIGQYYFISRYDRSTKVEIKGQWFWLISFQEHPVLCGEGMTDYGFYTRLQEVFPSPFYVMAYLKNWGAFMMHQALKTTCSAFFFYNLFSYILFLIKNSLLPL